MIIKRTTLATFICVLLGSSLFSQEAKFVSRTDLTKAIALSKEDNSQVLAYIDPFLDYQTDSTYVELHLLKAKMLKTNDLEAAIVEFDRLLSLPFVKQDEKWIIRVRSTKAKYLISAGKYLQADAIYKSTIKNCLESGDSLSASDLYIGLSLSLSKQSKFNDQVKVLHKSILISEDLRDTSILIKAFTNLGVAQSYIGQLDSSIINYNKVLEISRAKVDTNMIAKSLMNIGNVHTRRKNFTDGAKYLKQALDYYLELDSRFNIVLSYANLGVNAEKRDDPPQAIAYYKEAIAYAEPLNKKSLEGKLNGSLGSAYYLNGEYTLAKQKLKVALQSEKTPHTRAVYYERLGNISNVGGFFKKGKDYFQKAYELSKDIGDISMQRTSSGFIAFSSEKLGDYKNALQFKVEEMALTDSLFNIEKEKVIQEYDAKYELNTKEAEKKELESELTAESLKKKNYRRLLYVSLFSLAMLLFAIRNLFLKNKLRNANNELLKERNDLLIKLNKELDFEKSELEIINQNLTERINQKQRVTPVSHKLDIKSLDKKYLIDVKDIIYCKAEDEGVRIYLVDNKTLWSELKFKAFFEQLPKTSFLQIFRSTVVNIDHLEWVNHATLKMVNGDELKIGRTYKSDLKDLLG